MNEQINMATAKFPPDSVQLRDVRLRDLATFFEQQLDETAIQMAAFTAKDPADRDAFMARWTRILSDDNITKKTILQEGKVAGHVVCFQRLGRPEITYWIGKPYWGRGLATRALTAMLAYVTQRPLYARVAKDNYPSRRVLEKCGFCICGEDRGFSNARGREVEEYILKLDAAGERQAP